MGVWESSMIACREGLEATEIRRPRHRFEAARPFVDKDPGAQRGHTIAFGTGLRRIIFRRVAVGVSPELGRPPRDGKERPTSVHLHEAS